MNRVFLLPDPAVLLAQTAAFGPFVVLLGQDGAAEADQAVTAGEASDHVGAAADSRFSRSGGLPAQICLSTVIRKPGWS
jgi:hypothetical protein